MKKINTLLFLLITPLLLSAQRNFHRFSIGAGAGLTDSRGDLSSSQFKRLYVGSAEYYFTPYVAGVLEAQAGTLSGHDYSNNRYFNNSFKAGLASMKVYAGQFMDHYRGAFDSKTNFKRTMEGTFISAGAGMIKNNQTQIYRQNNNPLFQGSNSNKDIFIPVGVGIDNSGFNSRVIAGIRYQYNFVLGDQVDGYSMPGSRNDMYNTFTFSVKYKFGPKGIY